MYIKLVFASLLQIFIQQELNAKLTEETNDISLNIFEIKETDF